MMDAPNDFATADAASREEKTRHDATVVAGLELHFGSSLDPSNLTIQAVAGHFHAALDDPDPLPRFVLGLRSFAAALCVSNVLAAPDSEIRALRSIMIASGPTISDAAGGNFSLARVCMGIGAAIGLLRQTAHSSEPADLFVDRIDHLLALADELDALVRRRRIEARGDLLRRNARIAVAQQTDRDDRPLS